MTAPLIALLAHPDDEFAIFPWLSSAVREGREVLCVWLTDGGWGGQSTARRRRESVAVLTGLGLDPSSLHFLGEECGIADGSLYLNLDSAFEALKEVVGDSGPSELLMPAWEGGHHDHDALHLLGLRLSGDFKTSPRQYSLYHGEGLRGPWFKVLSPLAANGAVEWAQTSITERLGYVARCLKYRSQWKSFAGLLPFYTWRMLHRDAFALQSAAPERTGQRPHVGALLYERRGGPSWEVFSQATRSYRAAT